MCGITGGCSTQTSIDVSRVQRSLLSIAHRGPDSNGMYLGKNDSIALGHARLAIIDLAGGQQPLHSRDKKLHLVANGEIYNYKEVIDNCRQKTAEPITQSDCEAILQAYAADGEQGFRQLYGMFAFALYDESCDILFLCRDRLGIKPLFYTRTDKGIFFASEIKGLLPYLEHQPTVRGEALAQFLQHQFNTGRETIFEEIHRVLPGEYLKIENGTVNHIQYWSASDAVSGSQQNPHPSFDDALQTFDELFTEVLHQHTRADVPFGLFLSGGIDSSILLAKLSEIHSQKIETFSVGYQDTDMEDELDIAENLAGHFGTIHHSLKVSKNDLFERIVHSTWCADDLMRDYASLPTHLLSEYAGERLKIVFSGEGGDEAFAGYRRYRPTLGRKVLHGLLGRNARIHRNWDQRQSDSVFSNALTAVPSEQALIRSWSSIPRNLTYMQKRQLLDIQSALVDNLFVKADRNMMGFGLEGRVPFSDHRLIEFGLSLPDHYKYPKSRGKWLLREWAKSHLPADHLSAPKRGFYVPINEWLKGDFLKSLSQKLVNNHAIANWFSVTGVKSLLEAHQNSGKYNREVWGLMQFAIWHNLFVEAPDKIPDRKENPLDWI